MSQESGLQDSVEKGREAFRRSIPDASDVNGSTRRPEARDRGDLHPFFRGLLETLPELGSDWSMVERQQWLETARNIFALLYHDPRPDREPIPLRQRDQTTTYPATDQRSA